jgi:RNA-directed DNA polymerase
MHYAFDMWMLREYPVIRFERYADDVVVHCVTERQARNLVAAIGDRMEAVGLRLHPDKTKVVYCQDGNRRLDYGLTAFTFLGFTFRARAARTKNGTMFVSFQPAISKDAQNKISGQIRRWRLHRWIGLTLAEIARQINPVVRGWMQYYAAFYRSALYPLLARINAYVMRWIRNKYKRLRTTKKAKACWQRITSQQPRLFAHWAWVHNSWRQGRQEPGDERLSRRDLWEPEGATPSGYPTPAAADHHPPTLLSTPRAAPARSLPAEAVPSLRALRGSGPRVFLCR